MTLLSRMLTVLYHDPLLFRTPEIKTKFQVIHEGKYNKHERFTHPVGSSVGLEGARYFENPSILQVLPSHCSRFY